MVITPVWLVALACALTTAVVLVVMRRHLASLRRRFAALQRVNGFSRLLAGSPELESAIRVTLHKTRALLGAEHAELDLFAPDDGDGTVAVTLGADEQLVAVVNRRLVPRDRHATVTMPLVHDGVTMGTLAVRAPGEKHTFDEEAVTSLRCMAARLTDSLHRARIVDSLRRQAAERDYEALHDVLTGVGNRNLFVARAEEALRDARVGGWRVAVLLVDLNNFKDVNDTVGRELGDALLRQVAERVQLLLAASAMIARLGGDEFVVLVPQVRTQQDAERIAADLLVALNEPFSLGELNLSVGAAIGVAVSPEHGRTAPSLMEHAELAMDVAKAEPDGAVRVYASSPAPHPTGRLAVATELQHAIEHDELDVYYQPQAEMDGGAIVSVEALLRWRHPMHGPVPPEEFVAVAEHEGLMDAMTQYVLGHAVEQARHWHDDGLDVATSVNLSPPSLVDVALPRHIDRLLHEGGLEAGLLRVEVSETDLTTDPLRTLHVLEEIGALGVGVTVKDFGRATSSLAYLVRVPLHDLKIDQTLVESMAADEQAAGTVRAVVELGRSLGVRVIAAGVEDQMTWDMLAEIGCDVAQGYFLSRPLPADRLAPWLRLRAERVEAHAPRRAS